MNLKQRYQNLQTLLEVCGTDGCHFLTLCSIAEEESHKPVDLIDAIKVSIDKGWFTRDFWGKDAEAFLGYLTKKRWTRREVPVLHSSVKSYEYTEANWYNPRTGYRHHRRRGFDTIENSITVKEGYIESYYIYTCEDDK